MSEITKNQSGQLNTFVPKDVPSITPPSPSKFNLLFISLPILVVLVLVGIGVFVFGTKITKPVQVSQPTSIVTIQQAPIPFSWKNKVIYYKSMPNQPTIRAGIWEYDLETNKETQLLSFFDLIDYKKNPSAKLALYGRPILSPDKTKIALYVSNSLLYDLWLFNLVGGEKKKLLSQVSLYSGYTQEPVWSLDSNTLYITLQREGSNDLVSVDLYGNTKNLITGDVFWPNVVSNDTLVYNTQLPNSQEIGILNSKNNVTNIVLAPTSTYLMNVKKFQNNYLIKANFPNLTYSYGGTPDVVDKTTIYGLEKINLTTYQAETFKIPPTLVLDQNVKRIQVISFCSNTLVTLGAVENDVKSGEKYAAFYVYNLQTETIQKIIPADNNNFIPRYCNSVSPTELFYSDNQLKTINYNLTDRQIVQIKDYSKVIPNDIPKCLNTNVDYTINGLGGDTIYLRLWPGFDQCYVYSPKQGIYRINLKDNSFKQISKDNTLDEDDWVLVAEE